MKLRSQARIAAALCAATLGGMAVSAGLYGRAQRPAPTVRYYMECLTLRSAGNDINTQASQGWTVRAMVDHTTPEGQECLLVLFEQAVQGR